MRQVFKEGFGVGTVLESVEGNLTVKWVESGATTEVNEGQVKDVLFS